MLSAKLLTTRRCLSGDEDLRISTPGMRTGVTTVRVAYRFSDELKRRRKVFRSLARRKLGRFRTLMLSFRPTLNFGHASGTLRFGTDPSISVLDADCKAHDLANLYVTDASFMPTSMGVNPSLVIAANALRVADIIAARHDVLVRKAS